MPFLKALLVFSFWAYKSLDGDFSPKPTIFLPSIAETTLHKAGTYLCLLENFFPDAIQVYWKEKNSDKVLVSQQGNTMKTKDTYMKFSWLTVPQKSFSKEHRCIVKHETKGGGRDQEILFPAIQKGTVSEAKGNERKPDSVEDKQRTVLGTPDTERNATHDRYSEDVLMLQLTQTSAYYTYLLLLIKSAVYLAIVTFSMFRRTAICGVQRAPNQ
ncbi:TCR gamma alternate reading frame protein isoform X2 [Ochotona princeps]|uniref:TCR gamma alternate reading frame protein isoform X2 n=1 Tax=Ochotona princeps TaxID=9978 RepID=UPI002714E1C1|nr:TCR gamma alternate reading frame protein isoform X2 [Ochotona princeps]